MGDRPPCDTIINRTNIVDMSVKPLYDSIISTAGMAERPPYDNIIDSPNMADTS